MINPAQKPSNLNRREALQTVGATVALAAGGLTASAATTTINASDPNAGGFWPKGARLAVSLSLMFEGGGQPSPALAASSRIRLRRASRTCQRTPSSRMDITRVS